MTTQLPPPLSGAPPAELPLLRAPLVRVIGQIRFSTILAIRSPDTVAQFQEKIRATYPILEEERVHSVVMPFPGGNPEIREIPTWRFRDRDDKWRVSLAPEFVALEATSYSSRTDFLARLRTVVEGVEATFNPQEAQRIGLRYINRVSGERLANVASFLRDEVLGVASTNLGPLAQHILTDTLLQAEEGLIQARWGQLPAHATIDPTALEPIPEPSWVLDLDMFSSGPQAFAADGLITTATSFAERIYTVFRWMVTDAFLRAYGGNL
nr:TIGR04255 family protein [uncultured Rhodopila sp.]